MSNFIPASLKYLHTHVSCLTSNISGRPHADRRNGYLYLDAALETVHDPDQNYLEPLYLHSSGRCALGSHTNSCHTIWRMFSPITEPTTLLTLMLFKHSKSSFSNSQANPIFWISPTASAEENFCWNKVSSLITYITAYSLAHLWERGVASDGPHNINGRHV